LKKSLGETFDWLQDNAESADEVTLREKRQALLYVQSLLRISGGMLTSSDVEQPIIFRYTERQTRGKAVDDFQTAMLSARAFFVEAQKNQTIAIEAQEASTPEAPVAGPKFTKEELEVVEGLMKDNEKWMDPLMEVQVRLDKAGDNTEDPVIFTKDLNERGKLLQTTVCPIFFSIE
jgi:hypoxia up-regulated 1